MFGACPHAIPGRPKKPNQEISIMKKLILIIYAVFMLNGCGTQHIQYAAFVPPDKLCTLYIANTLSVKRFNSETVDWKVSGLRAWTMVQIPEGTHTFVADYDRTMNNARESATDIAATGNFTAGRTYHMFDGAPDSSEPFSGIRMHHLRQVAIHINEGRPPNS